MARGRGTRAHIQLGENQLTLGHPDAAATLSAARVRVGAQADAIPDVDLRRAFCEDIPEHARILSGRSS